MLAFSKMSDRPDGGSEAFHLTGYGTALGLLARVVLPGVLVALVAGFALYGAARLAARLLRSMIAAAIDPENLRVA